MKARPTQSRKGVKGQLPLAGSRDSVPCGVWGNAPTVPRATSMPNALNKGAGSEASLPVTLRFRRSAPKLLFPQDSVKNPIEAKHGRVRREGVSGATADFVCFHCPRLASAEAKSPAFREKPSIIGKTSYMVAPIWRDTAQMLGRAAWGRVCGRAKLGAGTLRCLHLCWRLP